MRKSLQDIPRVENEMEKFLTVISNILNKRKISPSYSQT